MQEREERCRVPFSSPASDRRAHFLFARLLTTGGDGRPQGRIGAMCALDNIELRRVANALQLGEKSIQIPSEIARRSGC